MVTPLAASTTCLIAQSADATQRDSIEDLLWSILTHNAQDRKYPIDDLVEMVHAYRGNKKLLAGRFLSAFAEAASYRGLNGEFEAIDEDPIKLAFRAMGEDVARAHRTH